MKTYSVNWTNTCGAHVYMPDFKTLNDAEIFAKRMLAESGLSSEIKTWQFNPEINKGELITVKVIGNIEKEMEERKMVKVVYLNEKGLAITKNVSVEDAIEFLKRADARNVPAYYMADKKCIMNQAAKNYSAKSAATASPATPVVTATSVTVKDHEEQKPVIELWSDGACSGNGTSKAIAGYGFILVMGEHQKEGSGLVEGKQTNNVAELTAVIKGLEALKKPCIVKVFTDSQVVTRAPQIINRGMKTADGKPAANIDLLERLAELFKVHTVTIEKVAGHANVALNEKCDALARAAVKSAK